MCSVIMGIRRTFICVCSIVLISQDWALFDRIRGQDIRLLKALEVGYIFDLMVEKKKVKYGMK